MAEVTVSADPSYGPPRNVIVAHATGGSILESCEVTRIVGGAEEPIRRQPIVGVSDVTLYDYEAPYDRSSVYRIQGLERNIDLVSAWTGDKNASTSQLSQDGQVVATNYVTDPNALQKVGTWSPAGSTTAVQRPDGHWVYTPDSDVTRLAFFIPINQLVQNDYVYCEWLGGTGDGYLENIDTVAHGNGWILGKNTNPAGNKTLYPTLNGTPITILKVGRYSAADYAAMQARGVTWFDGDSFQAGTTTQYDESSSPVTLSPDTGWLIHPGNPAKSMRLPLGHITGMGDTTRRSNATRHDILGARYPIYTNPGPRYSRELSMKLRTRTADDENMLDNLLDDQTPILFNPRGVDASRLNLNPMYLQVGDVTAARYAQSLYPTSDSPQHWRDWTLPCTQVDSPAVSQQAVGWTYAQLLNDNTRYQSVIISYKDYASLQAHSVKDGQ